MLALGLLFASVMVTGMRLFDAITDPIICLLYTSPRPHLPLHLLGSGLAILVFSLGSLYVLTPNLPHWMVQIFGPVSYTHLAAGPAVPYS